jgi:hypothetical protein
MPIYERDPWREQYFENIRCPDDVAIATDDIDAWPWYPQFNWVYDKLRVAQSQGISCGPHGVSPASYPVFSKPITNLKGMGLGSRVISNECEMQELATAGHFWMELFEGPHVSTDCAVVNGQVEWLRHAEGMPAKQGTFSLWILRRDEDPELGAYLRRWVARHMQGYTGMMNFESIGGRIIEAHLRFADQWCDLNGSGWIDAVVRLYERGTWQYADGDRREAYSIPLFVEHGGNFSHPAEERQRRIRAMPEVSSLQITFYESKDPEDHPMPPGGFRVGIVNAWNLQAGMNAIGELAKCFPQQKSSKMFSVTSRADDGANVLKYR